MTKKCPTCQKLSFPEICNYAQNAQTDETKEVVEWYCPNCRSNFAMTVEEEIEAYELMRDEEEAESMGFSLAEE